MPKYKEATKIQSTTGVQITNTIPVEDSEYTSTVYYKTEAKVQQQYNDEE